MRNLDINLRPSYWYGLWIAILVAMTMLSISLLNTVGSVRILLIFIVMLSGLYYLRADGYWRGKRQVIGIRYDEGTGWRLRYSSLDETSALVLADSVVTRLVSILRFQVPGKRFPVSVVIFRDALPQDLYRQLYIRLKFSGCHDPLIVSDLDCQSPQR